MWCTHRILDAKYKKYDLSKIVSDRKNINSDKQSMLYNVLTKYELIFDRNLGTWKTKSLDIELYPVSKTYHWKP